VHRSDRGEVRADTLDRQAVRTRQLTRQSVEFDLAGVRLSILVDRQTGPDTSGRQQYSYNVVYIVNKRPSMIERERPGA
jgi:hypothetical protein